MVHYVQYRMPRSEHYMNNFLDQLFPMQRNKALHHVRQIHVYLPRQNWGNNRVPNNISHQENVAVDHNRLLYPNDYLRVLQSVLN